MSVAGATENFLGKHSAYLAEHRLSLPVMLALVLGHAAVVYGLTLPEAAPMVEPAQTLIVQVISPAPPTPVVKPQQPRPVDVKPLVRRTPVASQILASHTEAPSVVSAPPYREISPVAPAAPSLPVPAVLSPPRFDAAYLNNPAPAYPAMSRRLGEEGRVILRVFVEPNGRPGQIEIKSSAGSSRLDQAAAEAVGRWQFVAARNGSEATGAWVLVPIVFNLRG